MLLAYLQMNSFHFAEDDILALDCCTEKYLDEFGIEVSCYVVSWDYDHGGDRTINVCTEDLCNLNRIEHGYGSRLLPWYFGVTVAAAVSQILIMTA